MAKKKIFLSPSNQYDNKYAYGGTTEDIQCGKIANALKEALIRCGFDVKVEQYDSMTNRVKHGNAWKADAYIPIHTNAFNKKVTGTRMFCYSKTGQGYKLCQAIFEYLAPLTPGTSENIKVDKTLYEVRETDMATAYIEVDFHDVKDIAKWIAENIEEIAEAICKGVCDYFKVTYKEKVVVSEEKKDYYRVRKSWKDAGSQKGAFENLENAVNLCTKSGPEYHVFNAKGEEVGCWVYSAKED